MDRQTFLPINGVYPCSSGLDALAGMRSMQGYLRRGGGGYTQVAFRAQEQELIALRDALKLNKIVTVA